MATANKPDDSYEEAIEEGNAPPQSIHRIRANSSIMQLKKLLGEWYSCELHHPHH